MLAFSKVRPRITPGAGILVSLPLQTMHNSRMVQNDNQIPVPDDSGSSGEQEPASSGAEVIPAQPQQGLPLADAVEGLASSRSRSLGEVGSVMIAAATRHIADENQELKTDKKNLQEQLANQRNELESARTRIAVLVERLDAVKGNKHVRNLAITVGTALASAGVMLSRDGINNYSVGMIVAGSLLLLVSWFAPSKGSEN